ncbi:MAG TPA: nuclease-related domain-containing protein [Pseudoxanthomonas sp.]
MLIKKADDQSDLLAALESEMNQGGPNVKKARDEFHIRSSGIRGEKDSAYLIDFDYARSPNWAVIHDLRVEQDGRSAQMDHVLINRWMDIYVLETKHFHSGLKITEDGEFLRWNNHRRIFEGMPSPLAQNERHIEVLKDVLAQIELPTRLGVRIAPQLQSFVLVAPSARIDRPKRFDASRVIKADQLKKAIWRDIENENLIFGLIKTAAKIVSGETVEHVARQLASRHAPLTRYVHRRAGTNQPAELAIPTPRESVAAGPSKRIEPTFGNEVKTPPRSAVAATPARVVPSDASRTAAACKSCGEAVGSIVYGKYGYYFRCGACETNTAIKFACYPGHRPRLRKDGNQFFRDCAECGGSTLFHSNVASGASRR